MPELKRDLCGANVLGRRGGGLVRYDTTAWGSMEARMFCGSIERKCGFKSGSISKCTSRMLRVYAPGTVSTRVHVLAVVSRDEKSSNNLVSKYTNMHFQHSTKCHPIFYTTAPLNAPKGNVHPV